ncbi:MAG TPA: PIN domain-containing protein [Chloroflexota bacterium]|jgi:predicted nucleic acid-binding protein|nr:PIN domain-containing protein [Chloroflexota bacterium]
MATASRRPFIDTNVLFSGFYRANSVPGRILEVHARGEITLVLSRRVLEELVRTIRAKMPLCPRGPSAF